LIDGYAPTENHNQDRNGSKICLILYRSSKLLVQLGQGATFPKGLKPRLPFYHLEALNLHPRLLIPVTLIRPPDPSPLLRPRRSDLEVDIPRPIKPQTPCSVHARVPPSICAAPGTPQHLTLTANHRISTVLTPPRQSLLLYGL
jgi:hypothetical protein